MRKAATIKVTAGGDTLTGIYPYLELIAQQNGLNLCNAREFKIARSIYEKSIICN
jgi:hypothetical protein